MSNEHTCPCGMIYLKVGNGLFHRAISNSVFECLDPEKATTTCPDCDTEELWHPDWAMDMARKGQGGGGIYFE